jgi:hypothetical protein
MAPGLARKYKTRLERRARDKHFVCRNVSNEEKSFITFIPDHFAKRKMGGGSSRLTHVSERVRERELESGERRERERGRGERGSFLGKQPLSLDRK